MTDCLTSLIKNKQFVQQENILIVLPQLFKIPLIHFSFGIMEYAIATCFITTFEVFTQGNFKKNYFYTYLKQSELYFLIFILLQKTASMIGLHITETFMINKI